MEERDLFAELFFLVMTFVLVTQFVLNFWAWRVQRRLERIAPKPIPIALKDREEVTFWQTVSSGLLAALGLRVMLDIPADQHAVLLIFGVALTVKTIPSARWLLRYYRRGFDEA